MIPTLDAKEAKFVLVEIRMNEPIKQNVGLFHRVEQRRVHGVIKRAIVLRLSGHEFIYININAVSMYDKNLIKLVGSSITGNFRHNFQMKKENTFYWKMMSKVPDSIRNNYYDYNTESKENQKITQFHHTHVLIRNILNEKTLQKRQIIKKQKTGRNSKEIKDASGIVRDVNQLVRLEGRDAVLAEALDKFSNIEATHATFWLYSRVCSNEAYNFLINCILMYGGISNDWLKYEGVKAKQLQGYDGLELNEIFELNVLVNRQETDVDWESEYKKRVEPKTVNISADIVYKHAFRLFSDAKAEGKKGFRYTFDEYFSQRSLLMPTGSVHSNIEEDRVIYKNLPMNIRNKKGFFSSINDKGLGKWISRPREIHSYTATKYEWGKTRALYGCDITSHVHADFGLNKCEETFPSYIPTGSKANEEYVNQIAKRLKNMIPVCYDYDDFNSQHTISSMKTVIKAWADVYQDDLSAEQKESILWTIDSINVMYVHDSFGKYDYRALGTLFSGWRLTTFINTALNYVYLAEAGLYKYMSYSIHNGDDVLAVAKDFGKVRRLIRSAEQLGIRAQVSKMNLGTISEFLRMDFQSTKSTCKQYLTRACATATHARTESNRPNDQRSMYDAYVTRAEEIIARGGNEEFINKHILSSQIKFINKEYALEDLYKEYCEYDICAGGRKRTEYVENYVLEDVKIMREDNKEEELLKPGIRSYYNYIKRRMPQLAGKMSMKRVTDSVTNSFNIYSTKMSKVESSKRELKLNMSIRGIWKPFVKIGEFAKARMTVSDVLTALTVTSPHLAEALLGCDDVYQKVSLMI